MEILYKISDPALVYISKIEALIYYINKTIDQNIKKKEELQNLSIEEEILYIFNLIHLQISRGDVRKIINTGIAKTKEEWIAKNYFDANQYILNKNTTTGIDFYDLQQILRFTQKNLISEIYISRTRNTYEKIKNKEAYDPNFIEYPKIENTNNITIETINYASLKKEIHPVIKSIIIFAIITSTAPFYAFNFIVGILLFKLVLHYYQYDLHGTIPTALSILQIPDLDNFIRKNINSENFVTELINLVSKEFYNILELRNRTLFASFENKLENLDLNERQINLINILRKKVYINRNEYCKLFKVSPMTAYRDLIYLCDKGILKSEGNGKSTKYSINYES